MAQRSTPQSPTIQRLTFTLSQIIRHHSYTRRWFLPCPPGSAVKTRSASSPTHRLGHRCSKGQVNVAIGKRGRESRQRLEIELRTFSRADIPSLAHDHRIVAGGSGASAICQILSDYPPRLPAQITIATRSVTLTRTASRHAAKKSCQAQYRSARLLAGVARSSNASRHQTAELRKRWRKSCDRMRFRLPAPMPGCRLQILIRCSAQPKSDLSMRAMIDRHFHRGGG